MVKQNNIAMLCNPSYQTIKNCVSDIGKLLIVSEIERIQKYFNNELEGKTQVEILFEEKDGLFLSMQGNRNNKDFLVRYVDRENFNIETEQKKAKKDVNQEVREILYEKGNKFSNREAHIQVFDN